MELNEYNIKIQVNKNRQMSQLKSYDDWKNLKRQKKMRLSHNVNKLLEIDMKKKDFDAKMQPPKHTVRTN